MFCGLLEHALATGLSRSVPAMLFASIIGGYVSFEPEYLLMEAENELEWFRKKDSSLMNYGTYSEYFRLKDHLREVEKVMGLE